MTYVGPSLQAFGQATATAAVAAPAAAAPAAVLLLGTADAPSGVATGFLTTTTPPTDVSHVVAPADPRLRPSADPAAVRRVGGLLSSAEIESDGTDPPAAAAVSAATAGPVAADSAVAAAAAAGGPASASGSGAVPAALTSAAPAAAAGAANRLIFVPTATDVAAVEKLVASLAAPGPSGEDANLLLTFTQLRCNLEGARLHLAAARPEEVGSPAPPTTRATSLGADQSRLLFQSHEPFPVLTHRGSPSVPWVI